MPSGSSILRSKPASVEWSTIELSLREIAIRITSCRRSDAIHAALIKLATVSARGGQAHAFQAVGHRGVGDADDQADDRHHDHHLDEGDAATVQSTDRRGFHSGFCLLTSVSRFSCFSS